MDNIKECTFLPMPELLAGTSCKKDWEKISAELSLVSIRRPNRSTDRTELNLLSPTLLSRSVVCVGGGLGGSVCVCLCMCVRSMCVCLFICACVSACVCPWGGGGGVHVHVCMCVWV